MEERVGKCEISIGSGLSGPPGPKPHEVVGATGFRARTHAGFLPATKRLTLNNGSRDSSVDVTVSRFHTVEPEGDLIGVQGVNTSGQAIVDTVLERQCLVQRLGAHDPKNGTKVLRLVEGASGLHTLANTRTPQATLIIQKLGSEQPGLSWAKLRETGVELAPRSLDDRTHDRLRIIGVSHAKRGHRIHELAAEPLRFRH